MFSPIFLVHGRSTAVHRDGCGLGPPGRRGPGRQAGYPQPAPPQKTRPRHAGSVRIPDDFPVPDPIFWEILDPDPSVVEPL
jgi:hypothetical protein